MTHASLSPDAARLVERLNLAPHPEGGFFRETWRSPLVIDGLPHGAPRTAQTAIYFLLPKGTFSALHRVTSEEIWHFYDGDPVDLHLIDGEARHRVDTLGVDFEAGYFPQRVVPAGMWQAAVPREDGTRGFSLCGCTVAPGFDFADFEMPSRDEILTRFSGAPTIAHVLTRLTR